MHPIKWNFCAYFLEFQLIQLDRQMLLLSEISSFLNNVPPNGNWTLLFCLATQNSNLHGKNGNQFTSNSHAVKRITTPLFQIGITHVIILRQTHNAMYVHCRHSCVM